MVNKSGVKKSGANKSGADKSVAGKSPGKTHPENISIVLVGPQSPGNIGSVARVMKNTGFRNLLLVNPVDYINDEAFSFACNAIDVLKGARVFKTLDSALSDSRFIVGTTRRKGRIRTPLFTLDEALASIITMAEKNPVSILFGREDRGLKNEEIPLCDMLVEIPSHGDYPSLNLSHAVFAVCHALFKAENPQSPSITAAPKNDVENMYAHLEGVLKKLGYGRNKKGEFLIESIMRNFRRLFGRCALMEKEVNMLRGVLTEVEKVKNKPGS